MFSFDSDLCMGGVEPLLICILFVFVCVCVCIPLLKPDPSLIEIWNLLVSVGLINLYIMCCVFNGWNLLAASF